MYYETLKKVRIASDRGWCEPFLHSVCKNRQDTKNVTYLFLKNNKKKLISYSYYFSKNIKTKDQEEKSKYCQILTQYLLL